MSSTYWGGEQGREVKRGGERQGCVGHNARLLAGLMVSTRAGMHEMPIRLGGKAGARSAARPPPLPAPGTRLAAVLLVALVLGLEPLLVGHQLLRAPATGGTRELGGSRAESPDYLHAPQPARAWRDISDNSSRV